MEIDIKRESYLDDISRVLDELAKKMYEACPTPFHFGYVEDHMPRQGNIDMALEYIKKATRGWHRHGSNQIYKFDL